MTMIQNVDANTVSYNTFTNQANSTDYENKKMSLECLINSFIRIALAFDTEISLSNVPSKYMIKKWPGDIKIKVCGSPSADDLLLLDKVIADLNSIIGKEKIYPDYNDANLKIYFGSIQGFIDLFIGNTSDHSKLKGANGLFTYNYNEYGEIFSGNVYISNNIKCPNKKSHVVHEELAQVLGLPNDSYGNAYKDSIFYQEANNAVCYSELDKWFISTLYLPFIDPGMSEELVRKTLNNIALNKIEFPPSLDTVVTASTSGFYIPPPVTPTIILSPGTVELIDSLPPSIPLFEINSEGN